jgi:uncharacterized membrane protein YdbT with pleckstrin-like domain
MHLKLLTNERIVFKTRVHMFSLFQWKTSVLFMLGLGVIVMGDIYYLTDQAIVFLAALALLLIVIMLFESFMFWYKTYVVLTNQRLLYSIGWISPFEREVSLSRITDISVGQGFFGRHLNFGTIFFNQDNDALLPLSMIARPYEFRHHVMSLLDPKGFTGA